MRRITLTLTLGAVFLIAAFNVLGQEQAPAPTFKDGNFWQFKSREWDFIGQSTEAVDGIYELVYSQGKIAIFQLTGDQKVDLARRPSSLLALLGLSKSPQYKDHLKFPLYVGKKWSFDYRRRLRGGRVEHSRSVEIHVAGVEDLATPAGKFRVFKLVKEDWSGQSRWLSTYYYSPETRSIVKSLYDSSVGTGSGGRREVELIKFGSAR